MPFRVTLVACLSASLLFVLSGCGGDGDSAGNNPPLTTNSTMTSESPNPADGDSREGQSDADLGDVPPAGEAQLQLDDETFAGSLHVCDIDPNGGFTVGATGEKDGDPVEFGANGSLSPAVVAQAGLTVGPASNPETFFSTNGSVTTDGTGFVYVGSFNNPAGGSSGEGRLSATCE